MMNSWISWDRVIIALAALLATDSVSTQAPTADWSVPRTASFANDLCNCPAPVPVGWGGQQPMIIVDENGDQFAPIWYIDTATGKYCFLLTKNGQDFALTICQGGAYVPSGATITESNQPPLFFLHGDRIVVAYWADVDSDGATTQSSPVADRSIINVLSVNTNQSAPAVWTFVGRYTTPSMTKLNYLGGAIDPNTGRIVIAGYGTDIGLPTIGPPTTRLEMVTIDPPYDQYNQGFSPKCNVLLPDASLFSDYLYPHLVIDSMSHVHVMFEIENGQTCIPGPCPPFSQPTTYKSVVKLTVVDTTPTPPFDLCTLSTLPGDTVIHTPPDGQAFPLYGLPCVHRSSRFPCDLFYDESDDGVYWIVRAQDVTDTSSPCRMDWNNQYTQAFSLYKNGQQIVADLSAVFTQFANPLDINMMTMTKLTDGRFVITANSRTAATDGNPNHINIVTTTDFATFSPNWFYSTQFGVGQRLRVSKPNKNGSWPSPKLHLFHGGDECNPTMIGNSCLPGPGQNTPHQFVFYRFTL